MTTAGAEAARRRKGERPLGKSLLVVNPLVVETVRWHRSSNNGRHFASYGYCSASHHDSSRDRDVDGQPTGAAHYLSLANENGGGRCHGLQRPEIAAERSGCRARRWIFDDPPRRERGSANERPVRFLAIRAAR